MVMKQHHAALTSRAKCIKQKVPTIYRNMQCIVMPTYRFHKESSFPRSSPVSFLLNDHCYRPHLAYMDWRWWRIENGWWVTKDWWWIMNDGIWTKVTMDGDDDHDADDDHDDHDETRMRMRLLLMVVAGMLTMSSTITALGGDKNSTDQ